MLNHGQPLPRRRRGHQADLAGFNFTFAQTIRPRVSLVKLTSPWQLGGNRVAFRRSAQESTVAREWQHISHYDILIIWRGGKTPPRTAPWREWPTTFPESSAEGERGRAPRGPRPAENLSLWRRPGAPRAGIGRVALSARWPCP